MSTAWNAGYVTDIGYTFGYYSELNPLRARLPLLQAGVHLPDIATACELGFGQGLSVNIHAAASGVGWHGTDFNPAQAAGAREMARFSGAAAQLSDDEFAAFCARTDLPEFDFIGLHGIWSWISDANRHAIVAFVRRKLKVGGVLYISYNTQPGWAAMLPLRDLMVDHAQAMAPEGGGIVRRIDETLGFVDRVFAVKPGYLRANPQMAERFAKLKGMSRNYLAHEYFNRDWEPMSFARMSRWMADAKLSWVASAHPLDAIDAINLTAEQSKLLASIPDLAIRQTTRDLIVNQQFRRDLWVKGPRSLAPLDRSERMAAQRVVLVQPRAQIAAKVAGALGEATLPEPLYRPALDALADHAPRSFGQWMAALKGQGPEGRGIALPQLFEIALVLSGIGALMPAQDDERIAQAVPRADMLNRHLLQRARGGAEITVLASPVTGGGVSIGRMQQIFLLARSQGRATPADWAGFAWDVLAAQGQRVVREGKPLERAEDNRAELTRQAEDFAAKTLPMLLALRVV
jgi:SAM-dependent methyltransferase